MSSLKKSAYLPELDTTGSIPQPGQTSSRWGRHLGTPVMGEYSRALVTPAMTSQPERMKSLPTPWARLLLFEQALFSGPKSKGANQAASTAHPAHRAILNEWRGLMGVIALSERLGIALSFESIDLPPVVESEEAMRSLEFLSHFVPVEDDIRNWNRLGLISIDGQLIGATSPRTLFFTGIRESRFAAVPFVERGRLIDPAAYFSGDRETLGALAAWLKSLLDPATGALRVEGAATALKRFLGTLPGSGGLKGTPRSERVLALLEDWSLEIDQRLAALNATPSIGVRRANDRLSAIFPASHPAHDVFDLFGPLVTQNQQPGAPIVTDLAIELEQGNVVVLDPGTRGSIRDSSAAFNGPIRLAAATVQVTNGRLPQSTTRDQIAGKERCLDFGSMWEPAIIEVNIGDESAACLLKAGDRLFLLPFKKTVLDFVDAERLARWTRVVEESSGQLRVTVEMPVRGKKIVHFEHVFDGNEIVSGPNTPNLSYWPDFVASDWRHYHYVVQETATTGNLQLKPGNTSDVSRTLDDKGTYWFTSERPILCWSARYEGAEGLLVLRKPRELPDTKHEWEVSVDFGSTHSRVFYQDKNDSTGKIEPLPLEPSRSRRVLSDNAPIDLFFFADRTEDPHGWVEPWSLVYLPRGIASQSTNHWLPADGMMYMAEGLSRDSLGSVRSNLKWHDKGSQDAASFENYLTHLVLAAKAEARVRDARITMLRTAVPSVFPSALRNRHRTAWSNVTTRVGLSPPETLSESGAVAGYLVANHEGFVSQNIIAIDIGGSTSDIAIWHQGRQRVSDSVRLAGDVLSRVLEKDAAMRDAVTAAARAALVIEPDDELPWSEGKNGSIFTSVLHRAANLKKMASFAGNFEDGAGGKGRELRSHLALLYAALAYTSGCLAKMANVGGSLYYLRFAGRGAQFLEWLDPPEGTSVKTVTRFFQLGLEDAGAKVDVATTGEFAKQEVGRGLLAELSPDLMLPEKLDRETYLLEEGFRTSAGPMPRDSVLTAATLRGVLPASVSPIEVGNLGRLVAFVAAFESEPSTTAFAQALRISTAQLDQKFVDMLVERLFGPKSAHSELATGKSEGDALIEPFLVTELKVLLEYCSGRPGLFN